MADPYGSSESEDISSFLQIILHNSSSSAAVKDSAASAPAGALLCRGDAPPQSAEYASGANFSDPGSFIDKESDEFNTSSIIKHSASSFEFKESEASGFRPSSAAPRSSKRTRAAEVHNLSEKRRRSRINEKLKALQSLVPNSNKTDKASMLEEAIEYLKQLQLQVQMLTMRNGMTLHPGYTLGSLQSTLVGPHEPDLVDGNSFLDANRGSSSISAGHDVLMHNTMENVNLSFSTQQIMAPSTNNNTSDSGFLPSIVPSFENHYGYFSHLAATKGICEDDTLSRLQLGAGCSRDNSSPSREFSS